MSHYAPFRRKRLHWRRRRTLIPGTGLPLEPDPVQSAYSYPVQTKPKTPAARRQKLAYTSLAVLAAGSVVVTGLAMAPRTPPPASGAAEAYLAENRPDPGAQGDPSSVPPELAALGTEITASLAAATWPDPLLPGEPDPERDAAMAEAASGCSSEEPGARECTLAPGDMPRTAVVVGDGSAASWVPALRRTLEPQGWRVLSLAYLDCPLPLEAAAQPGAGAGNCAAHAQAVVRSIAEARPGLVILSNVPPAETEAQTEAQTEWEQGLKVLHGQWLAPAGRVLALGPVPQVQEAEPCREAGRTPAECTVLLDPAWSEQSDAERRAAEDSGAAFLDPLPWFCDSGGSCPSFVGGAPVRQDGALSPAYAARLDPVLSEAVLSALKNQASGSAPSPGA